MKYRSSKISFLLRTAMLLVFVGSAGFFTGCDDDDPAKEDVPELITTVTLTFTPAGGGDAVVATATDPDGNGSQDVQVDGPINLLENTAYTLAITLVNELADPSDAEYDITAEVEEEADEHMFFFAWTNNVFADPAGNGNIDSRDDAVNYNDEDDNGYPLGLHTDWATGAAASGVFQLLLKHQPGLKSAMSASGTGETDLDLEFTINIVE